MNRSQGLANVVYAVALMGYCPGKVWLVRFHRLVDSHREIHPASMAMLQKAYRLLRFTPYQGADPDSDWSLQQAPLPHLQHSHGFAELLAA